VEGKVPGRTRTIAEMNQNIAEILLNLEVGGKVDIRVTELYDNERY